VLFHVVIGIGLCFWIAVHIITHLVSFGLDTTIYDSFRSGIDNNTFPAITGFLALAVLFVMTISSVKFLRAQFRFVPFKILHWTGTSLFYLLILVHGVSYWNPSFWKWFLPALVIFTVERLYRHVVVKKRKVDIKSAGRYDSISRTAVVELQKPRNFEYEPGQYVLLNVPNIGE
jgi:DMSO/TMAO reductase YedYZ heme-binding membrane subunit